MERKGRTEVKGWMDDLDNAMLQALADGNHGELRRIIDELEQMIAAARSNLDEIERNGGKSADDGRDYTDEIEQARATLRDLRSRAEAIVDSEAGPREIQSELATISGEVSRLKLRIPVRDYHANDISEGQEVDAEATELSIWLEDQYSRFRLNGKSAEGKGAKGDGKSWPGSPEIVGAFARDPVDADEAERMWEEFVRWAEGFESDPDDAENVNAYVEAARDDFNLAVPQGRAEIERALASYRGYVERIFERRKSARRPAAKARPTSAHRLYA